MSRLGCRYGPVNNASKERTTSVLGGSLPLPGLLIVPVGQLKPCCHEIDLRYDIGLADELNQTCSGRLLRRTLRGLGCVHLGIAIVRC